MKYRIFPRRQFLKLFLGASAAACFPACAANDLNEDDQLNGAIDPEPSDSQRPDAFDGADIEIKESTNRSLPPGRSPAVIWLEAQDCAGCTESLFSSLDIDYGELLLNDICITYHETLMFDAGERSTSILERAISEGNYLLVIEGAFPAADSRYLQVHGEPLEQVFISAAKNASTILAVGTCACFGAIPKSGPTRGRGVREILAVYNVNKSIINVPGCPIHPVWFLDTIKAVSISTIPTLDGHLRPTAHFRRRIHDQCPRREFRNTDKYLADWNNPDERKWCLYRKGCKGEETYADCPKLLWNDRASWCIDSGAPCTGCTEPSFCCDQSALYSNHTA
jgi:hydrogenase small subunit